MRIVFFTLHVVRSTMLNEGRAMPLLVTMA
jgi:hypothetical protein